MKPHDVAFTPEAEEQLAELYRYIEENANADVAPRESLVDAILASQKQSAEAA